MFSNIFVIRYLFNFKALIFLCLSIITFITGVVIFMSYIKLPSAGYGEFKYLSDVRNCFIWHMGRCGTDTCVQLYFLQITSIAKVTSKYQKIAGSAAVHWICQFTWQLSHFSETVYIYNTRHYTNNCLIEERATDQPLIARFMGPTRGPSRADRTKVGTVLAPWTLFSVTKFNKMCIEQGLGYLLY